jgi:tRNA (guanine37-N1)-methyltransferase
LLLNVSSALCVNEGGSLRKRLRKTLAHAFPAEGSVGVYNAFDIIGDIAITKVPKPSTVGARDIAEAIMKRHRNVKAVFVQDTGVRGDFRLRSLVHVAGENRTRTVHKESGCSFAVDVEKCYFSPRLSHERLRIAQLVQPDETLVNMFAGVGCFSIMIAKRQPTAKVFSIDINPAAVQFMQENIKLNRVFNKVVPLLGDSTEIVKTQLQHCADRVLMPLPEKAYGYLPCAVSALKLSGGWIHIHAFEHATKTENPAEKVKQKVKEKLDASGVAFEIPFVRVVRNTGPNWWQLVADVHMLN